MTETAKTYYKNLYNMKSKEELINEIFRLKEALNVRDAMKADGQWISNYKEVRKNAYLFSADLVKDNQFLKQEVVRLEEIIEGLIGGKYGN